MSIWKLIDAVSYGVAVLAIALIIVYAKCNWSSTLLCILLCTALLLGLCIPQLRKLWERESCDDTNSTHRDS